MNIPEEYPQFTDRAALLIVTGAQDADFYFAHDGVMEKIDSFKIEKPHYSDNEGFSETRSGGRVLASGSAKEGVKEKVLADFLHEFKIHSKDAYMKNMPDALYVFTPGYMVHFVTESLLADAERRIVRVFRGNYYDKHPTEFLQMIQKVRKEKSI